MTTTWFRRATRVACAVLPLLPIAASAQDTAMLFAHVRRTVLAQTGIELQPEVHFVGVFTADTPQETVRANLPALHSTAISDLMQYK